MKYGIKCVCHKFVDCDAGMKYNWVGGTLSADRYQLNF